jgi:hypothetical protein
VCRAALSSLMVVLFLAALAVASSGWLHHCLHEDSANPHHFCAVKVLAQSHADCPTTETALPVPTQVEAPHRAPELWLRAAPDYALPPGRAPPLCA